MPVLTGYLLLLSFDRAAGTGQPKCVMRIALQAKHVKTVIEHTNIVLHSLAIPLKLREPCPTLPRYCHRRLKGVLKSSKVHAGRTAQITM